MQSWWWGKTARSPAGDCTGVVELEPKYRRRSVSQAKLMIMYPHFAGGSLRHPSCVAAVHHSFTEIDLHRSYILHNIRSIYVHIRRRDVQAIGIMCLRTAQFLYSKIIVKIRINTPVFAHINVNAVSPHLTLRF